jgi:hypothetical protein
VDLKNRKRKKRSAAGDRIDTGGDRADDEKKYPVEDG